MAEPALQAADPSALVADLRALLESHGRHLERWLGKREIAAHLSCSTRWIEERVHDGMPHAVIAGALKFRASEVERWLASHGHLERRGWRGVDDRGTVVVGSTNGAAPRERPAPGHEE